MKNLKVFKILGLGDDQSAIAPRNFIGCFGQAIASAFVVIAD